MLPQVLTRYDHPLIVPRAHLDTHVRCFAIEYRLLHRPCRICRRNVDATKDFLALFQHIFSADTVPFKTARRYVKVVTEHRAKIIIDIERIADRELKKQIPV